MRNMLALAALLTLLLVSWVPAHAETILSTGACPAPLFSSDVEILRSAKDGSPVFVMENSEELKTFVVIESASSPKQALKQALSRPYLDEIRVPKTTEMGTSVKQTGTECWVVSISYSGK